MKINKRRGKTCFKCRNEARPVKPDEAPEANAAIKRAISTGRGKPGDFFELMQHCGVIWATNTGLKNYYVMTKKRR